MNSPLPSKCALHGIPPLTQVLKVAVTVVDFGGGGGDGEIPMDAEGFHPLLPAI